MLEIADFKVSLEQIKKWRSFKMTESSNSKLKFISTNFKITVRVAILEVGNSNLMLS